MRKTIIGLVCLLTLSFCALLGARSQDEALKIRVRLMDARDGKDLGGMVRVYADKSTKPLALPGLFDRLLALKLPEEKAGWHVVPAGGAETMLPQAKIRIEALSGLETSLARDEIDLAKESPAEIKIELKHIFRPEAEGLAAGNTHLHLMKVSRAG